MTYESLDDLAKALSSMEAIKAMAAERLRLQHAAEKEAQAAVAPSGTGDVSKQSAATSLSLAVHRKGNKERSTSISN